MIDAVVRRNLLNAYIAESLKSGLYTVDGTQVYRHRQSYRLGYKRVERMLHKKVTRNPVNGMTSYFIRSDEGNKISIPYADILYVHYHGPVPIHHHTRMTDLDDLTTLQVVTTSQKAANAVKARKALCLPSKALTDEQVSKIRKVYRANTTESTVQCVRRLAQQLDVCTSVIYNALRGTSTYANLNLPELPITDVEALRKRQLNGRSTTIRPRKPVPPTNSVPEVSAVAKQRAAQFMRWREQNQ